MSLSAPEPEPGPVTPARLRALCLSLTAVQVGLFVAPLNAALLERGLTDPPVVAAVLAQLCHESRGLTRWHEDLAYSAERLLEIARRRVHSLEQAAAIVQGGPAAIADALYGNRPDLGNDQPGDGYRFRGRGPHQLTGRRNYTAHGTALGARLAEQPDLVAEPITGFRSAALTALDCLTTPGIGQLDTVAGFLALSRRWNGARAPALPNGWDDRLARWGAARRSLGLPPVSEAA